MEDNTNNVTEPQNVITPPPPPVPENVLKHKIAGFFSSVYSKRRIITGSVGTLALISFLAAGIYLTQQRQNTETQAAGAVLSLSTTSSSPQIGDTFVVAVGVDTKGMNMSAVTLKIKYDPAVLQLVSGQPMGFLSVTLAAPSSTPDGVISASYGAKPGETKTGTGVIAQIVFKAKTAGATTVSFAPGTVAAAIGESDRNIIGTLTSVQINIGGGGGPTTNPTVGPTTGPTSGPTTAPTIRPTTSPTVGPTTNPTTSPTQAPSGDCISAGGGCYGRADTRCCAPASCRQNNAKQWYCKLPTAE